VDSFTLTNAAGMEIRFLAYGGTIVSMRVPDRHGVLADVTPGFDSVEDYLTDGRFFGALVGRYANRIAGGRFRLDGVAYELSKNEGPNQLHGGPRGFDKATWRVTPFETEYTAGAVLRHRSPAGDQGFPGTLEARVTYTLTNDNAFIIDYRAIADEATPVNLTQHVYFNLAGHDAGEILDHELALNASHFTPVDAALIPTGEIAPVRGTPFDFTTPQRIGARIHVNDEQIRLGNGYDHNFVIDRRTPDDLDVAARVYEPTSGRVLEIVTSEPGVQFYSGSGLAGGASGKGGHRYVRSGAFALETQHFPDSPNQPRFPSTILRPGEEYRSQTAYVFSVQ
jgi:aldose 1-epimerase